MRIARANHTNALVRLAWAAAFMGAVVCTAPAHNTDGIEPRGLTLNTLSFAIVGDCHPAVRDDAAAYPTGVITKIWQEIEAATPRPAFAITTGNYMFASTTRGTQRTQLGFYLAARSNFANTVFPAMGNQECNGNSSSNCGPGNPDGVTANYTAFLSTMLQPIRIARPYYRVDISAPDGSWSAKILFVASNAWNVGQAQWLNNQLLTPTTYTFVVMNSPSSDTTAPCLSATGANNAITIINQHPHTLLIVGHRHTFAYYANLKEVVVGNGGAPLSGNVNYGYVIARQQPNRSIVFTEYDYATNAAQSTFTVPPG